MSWMTTPTDSRGEMAMNRLLKTQLGVRMIVNVRAVDFFCLNPTQAYCLVMVVQPTRPRDLHRVPSQQENVEAYDDLHEPDDRVVNEPNADE